MKMIVTGNNHDDMDMPHMDNRGWRDTSRRLFQERKIHTSHVIPSHSGISEIVDNDDNTGLLSGEPGWAVRHKDSDMLRYTLSETIADLRSKPAEDRHRGVSIGLICQGIAILTGLTVFLLNKNYFEEKLCYVNQLNATNSTNEYVQVFHVYHQAALFLPLFLAALFHTLLHGARKPSSRHIVFSMITMYVPVLLSVTFIILNLHLSVLVYFIITFLSFVLLSATVGVLMSSLYSLVALYPTNYINFIIIGMNLAGFVIVAMQACIHLLTASERVTTVYCLVATVLTISIAIITYLSITRSKFHKHYKYLHYLVGKDYFETEEKSCGGFPYVMRNTCCVLVSIFIVHFTSFSIYPHVLAEMPLTSGVSFIHIPNNFWSLTTSLLLFNAFAVLGNVTAHFCKCPGPRWVIIPALLHAIVVLPLYGLCNYRETSRHLPVYIDIDVVKMALTAVTAYTGGYLASVAVIYTPRLVQARYASVAGMLASVFMALGMGGGICASHLYTFIIDTVGE